MIAKSKKKRLIWLLFAHIPHHHLVVTRKSRIFAEEKLHSAN